MIPIDQTLFDSKHGNCFGACVASLLHIPLESIPNYKGEDWHTRYNLWFKREHAMFLLTIKADNDEWFFKQIADVYHLIGGKSPRFDCLHACVGLGGKIVHDPHPSRLGLKTIEDFSFLIPCNPFSQGGVL